jgi:hypothetical protein
MVDAGTATVIETLIIVFASVVSSIAVALIRARKKAVQKIELFNFNPVIGFLYSNGGLSATSTLYALFIIQQRLLTYRYYLR